MENEKKHLPKLATVTLLWVVSTALATFGGEFLWGANKTYSALAIGLNFVIGIAMVLVNRKLLFSGDELQQKIQLESMGITLGLTVVGGISYSLLDISNVIASDAEISYLVIFISLVYLISLTLNTKKYK